MENKEITIFLKNGETLKFVDVKDLNISKRAIRFCYVGWPWQQVKTAVFSLSNIAGWSGSENVVNEATVLKEVANDR